MRTLLITIAITALISPANAQVDTDGDGLLDLIDVEGFDPNARGDALFQDSGIQDLDGVNQLTNLERLFLGGNGITSIESGDFEGLNNLRELRLDFNLLMSIESRAFEGLTSLQTLGLRDNRITSIETDGFAGLTNLRELRLWRNRITSIETGDFEGLNNLQELLLNGNRIVRIAAGGFVGLTNLRELRLDLNLLTSIESRAFEGLTNLEGLSLHHNRITSIDRGDFEGLTNLRTLFLNDNDITNIESGAFQGLNNLHGLRIDRNQLSRVQNGAFEALTDLQILWLDENQITSIGSGAFDGMNDLTVLYLNDNRITNIESRAFNGLTELDTLSLTGNRFSTLSFTGAKFERLNPCGPPLGGFCLDSHEVTSLILDDATLSDDSFDTIVGETNFIIDVSLVGLTFSNVNPVNVDNLLGIATLENVTVDQALFNLYFDEFNAFDAIDGNTVTVVPGLCDVDRNEVCDANDIDTMTQIVADGVDTAEQRTVLIEREMPHGFHTYVGDSNLDGQFDEQDIIDSFIAGKYLTDERAGWAEGDWSGDFVFDEVDFVAAFVAGGYLQGPRSAAVPEPSSLLLAVLSLISLLVMSRRTRFAYAGLGVRNECARSASV